MSSTTYNPQHLKSLCLSLYKQLLEFQKDGLQVYEKKELKESMQETNDNLQHYARQLPIFEVLKLGLPVYVPFYLFSTSENSVGGRFKSLYKDTYNKRSGGYWWPMENVISKELEVFWKSRNDGRIEDDGNTVELDRQERNFVVVLPMQPVVGLEIEEYPVDLSIQPEALERVPFPTQEPPELTS